jgi:hypothetical protein
VIALRACHASLEQYSFKQPEPTRKELITKLFDIENLQMACSGNEISSFQCIGHTPRYFGPLLGAVCFELFFR